MTDAERKDPLKERVQIEIRVRRDAPDNLRVAFIDTMGSGSISSTALDSKNKGKQCSDSGGSLDAVGQGGGVEQILS